MIATPDSMSADPDQRIADLERQLAEREAELAERTAERDEALQRETATAEVLQVINSSPGDLAPVFDVILEKAHRLCDAPCGSLQIFEGEQFRAVATRGMAEAYAAILQRGVHARVPDPNAIVQFDFAERLAQDPGNQNARAAVEIGKLRTILFVPLLKENVLIGRIAAARQDVRPFTDKQIALLQNFAAQAVIAMENARLLTETREALEQQTATAEVLQVINSSPGDLAPVFEAMLDKALQLCEASFGDLITFDGQCFNSGASRGLPEFNKWAREAGPLRPGPGTTMARMVQGERLIHIADLADDAAYRAGNPVRRALVEIGGLRTFLGIALWKDDTLLGALQIYRQEVRPFSDKQIALLQNFAAQAVIAMENARLITETREALEQQTATAEILRVISRSPTDLQPTFDAIAANATILSGAENAGVLRFDGSLIHFVAHYGFPPDVLEAVQHDFPIPPGRQSTTARAILTREVAHIPDVIADPEYALRAVLQTGVRTMLSVPILREGNPVGAITVARGEVAPFSQAQIDLLKTFADQAVIAIENVRLFNELNERTSDLEQSLEYQTATSDVLNVISRSTSNVQPVLDTVTETAARLCGADGAAIWIREGEVYRPVSAFAVEAGYWAALRQRTIVPGRKTIAARVALEGRIVHVPDIRAEPEFAFPEAVASGRRTMLGVPLLRDNEPLGVIALGRQRVEPFTERQIELVRTFADQAVIAIENARLFNELQARTEEVAAWNRQLEDRVAEQVDELGRVGRLKRFLAPQLAELIVSHGDEKILESHRREIVVVFCDLRGYTAFTETAEPEEVLDFLREYHGALGPLVSQFEGTLDQFSGDGIMVFFNDPVPIPDPAERAVKMAMAMREAAGSLIAVWRRRDRDLGFGAGIAQGYATLGQIGFAERSGYTAIGTVCNLAARLCAEAKDGQILISGRVAAAAEKVILLEDLGSLTLKGLSQPVSAFNVPLAATQPALRVIEGGPPSV
jgi:GAF domain-containing protein